jgi:hypothetical protein
MLVIVGVPAGLQPQVKAFVGLQRLAPVVASRAHQLSWVPFTHVAQFWKQAPQFRASTVMLISHPSPTWPLQSA